MPRKRRSNVQKAENASNQLKPRPVAIHESKTNPEETKPEIDVNPLHKKTEKSTDFKKVDSINANISSDIMGDIREEPSASTSMTEDLLSSSCKTRSGARGGNEHTKERLKETVRMSSNKEQAHKRKGSQRENGDHQATPHMPSEEHDAKVKRTPVAKKKIGNRLRKKIQKDMKDDFISLKDANMMIKGNLCSKCKGSEIEIRLVDDENSSKQILACCRTCGILFKTSFDRSELPESGQEDIESTSESDSSCDCFDLDEMISLGSFEGSKYLVNLNFGPHADRGLQSISHAVKTLQRFEDNKPLIIDSLKKLWTESSNQPDEQEIRNICVAYYSFITRDIGSLIGVGVIVEPESGFIIDTHVSCIYCSLCKRQWITGTKAKFNVWYKTHVELCKANFEKELESDNMKSEIAIQLCKNSLDLGLRYSEFIQTDESAVYEKLCESKVYGDHNIRKMTFINHVSSKIYLRLEDRIFDCPKDSDEEYFSEILKRHLLINYKKTCDTYPDNHPKVRDSMTAVIEHHTATDENPTHNACIPRFCRYKREVEQGKIPGPGWHLDPNNRKYSINPKVAGELKKYIAKYIQESCLARVTGHGETSDKILQRKIRNFLPNAGKVGVQNVKVRLAYVAHEHNEGLKEAAIPKK